MYKNRIPKQNEIVFVQLSKSVNDNYVKLIDYDLNGLILCTEITKYKDNLKNIVKIDEVFPVLVLDINNNNNIDLSYSKIKNDKRELLKNCYIYQNKFYKFIKRLLETINIDKCYYNDIMDKYINSDNYIISINENKNVPKEKYENFLLNPDTEFEENINNLIKLYVIENTIIKPYECEYNFKLSVYDNNSLCILKEILYKIKNINDIELYCISSPNYKIKIKNVDINNISKLFEEIKDNIIKICKKYNCNLEFESDYIIIKKIEIESK
jgi:translation initiation factor 2 alpha subunit (eIF-2alpha)